MFFAKFFNPLCTASIKNELHVTPLFQQLIDHMHLEYPVLWKFLLEQQHHDLEGTFEISVTVPEKVTDICCLELS